MRKVTVGLFLAALFLGDVEVVRRQSFTIPDTLVELESSYRVRLITGASVAVAQTVDQQQAERKGPPVKAGNEGIIFQSTFSPAQGYVDSWKGCPGGGGNNHRCPDGWNRSSPRSAGSIDDLGNEIKSAGNWTTSDDKCGYGAEINDASNYPGGGGGKGVHHCVAETFLGSGGSDSSGILVYFAAGRTQVAARWYQNWRLLGDRPGFRFPGPNYTGKNRQSKDIYWNVSLPRRFVITGYKDSDWYTHLGMNSSNNHSRASQRELVEDGNWHCLQIRYKVDTNGSDGILQMWANGNPKPVLNITNADLNGRDLGNVFERMKIGANTTNASTGFSRYDDFVVSDASAPPSCF